MLLGNLDVLYTIQKVCYCIRYKKYVIVYDTKSMLLYDKKYVIVYDTKSMLL